MPPHRHDLQTRQSQARLGAQLGLGGGWQAAVSLPLDLRVVQVDYTTVDGAPFDPPYDDIHHRDEVLWGPSDGSLVLQRLHRGAGPLWVGELGLSLPLGRTEADPYAAAARGAWHQHNQLGAGRPLALAGGGLLWAPRPWGGQARLSARVPFLENSLGYTAPMLLTVGGGPLWRLSPRWVALSGLDLVREGPERWSGEAHGGRSLAQLSLGAEWAISPRWSVQLEGRQPVYQHTDAHSHGAAAAEEGELRVGPLFGLTLAWTGSDPSHR